MNQNKFKIFNKEYDTERICTINYKGDKVLQQRRLKMNTVPANVPYDKFTRYVYAAANTIDIECIIVNGKPNDYLTDLLSKIYWANAINEVYDKQLRKMVKVNDNKTLKDIYYKEGDTWFKFLPNPKESASDRHREKKIQTRVAVDRHTEELYNGMRIPEDRKLKMIKYIKYYDLDMPQTEPEWVTTFHQLSYYIKNNIGFEEPEYTEEELIKIDNYQMSKDDTYGYDTNRYYICKECGELVHRGTEHCCYCDIPTPRTKIDYIVNGGE